MIENEESIDTGWCKNLDKIEGVAGIPESLMTSDGKDIFSRLVKVLRDKNGLPGDMDNPESDAQVERVDEFAKELYEVGCDLAEIAEAMMVGAQVEKQYEDIQDEKGNTRNMMAEAGHLRSDF